MKPDHLLTGCHIFSAGLEVSCSTVRRVPEECPVSIAQLIADCLDHKPANRPSAKELVGILNEQGRTLEQLRGSRGRDVSPVNSRVRWRLMLFTPLEKLPLPVDRQGLVAYCFSSGVPPSLNWPEV